MNGLLAGAALALLALLLAGPVPTALAQAQWPRRSPWGALILWQSVAVTAALSASGSGAAIASLLITQHESQPSLSALWWYPIAMGVFSVVIFGRFVVAATKVGLRTRKRRSQHRTLLALAASSTNVADLSAGGSKDNSTSPKSAPLKQGTGLSVLDSDFPLAYSVPGQHGDVVLTQGAINQLSEEQLSAVLAHEASHLRWRHDLVVEFFTAIHAAFPRIVRSQYALEAVEELIEYLADDDATDYTDKDTVISALAVIGQGQLGTAPSSSPAESVSNHTGSVPHRGVDTAELDTEVLKGSVIGRRILRLIPDDRSPVLSTTAAVTASALFVLPTILIVAPGIYSLVHHVIAHS